MTQEIVDRLLDPIQTNLFTTDPLIPLFSDAIQDPQDDLKKQSIFKPVSEAEKSGKSDPKAPEKHQKSTLESPINVFGENLFFAIPSMRKPCFRSSNCQ